jgi:high mobility group protein 2-like 1
MEMPTVAQNVELPLGIGAMDVQSFNSVPDGSVTKSGRVRKKSAKWMEMEETDELEKMLGQPKSSSRKGRGGGGTGTFRNVDVMSVDQLPFSFDEDAQQQLQSMAQEDRQVKVHFSLNSTVPEPLVSSPRRGGSRPKKDNKRKRSESSFTTESEAEIEFGISDHLQQQQQLVINKPVMSYGVGHEPLRMRLTVASDSTASITNSNSVSEQHSPKKAHKTSKKKSMMGVDQFGLGGQYISDGLITIVPSLAHSSLSPAENDVTNECSVTDYLPSRNRHRKNLVLEENEGTAQVAQHGEADYRRIGSFSAKSEGSSIDKQQQPSLFGPNQPRKVNKQPKKKRQKGYTAYMLWCSTQRAKLVAVNPGIDFAAVSKRLGDMWQTVPEKEKMTWRRKARRLSKKGTSLISTGKIPREGGPARRGRPPSVHRTGDISRSLYHGNKMIKYHSPGHDDLTLANFKVVGTSPLDAAAHLKLLGESLAVIGSRLKEHRGQIAVQGSLSVLLDSMLCALGPLMCLTSQVPELNGSSEELHASTLNNIAFIMPGVG